MEELWLIPLGIIAGTLGSLIGLGGGMIVVTILSFAGFPPTLAASTSLFGGFGNALSSSISYSRQNKIDFTLGLKMGLFTIPGTILGALLADNVTPEIFKVLFAIMLVISSLYIFIKRKIELRESHQSSQLILIMIVASFAGGIISSFFGVGGGVLFVPIMVVMMGLTIKIAAPTSQFILLFAALSGIIIHSVLGNTDFYFGLFLAIGTFIGGFIGPKLSLEIRERKLKIIVSVVLIAAATKLIFDSFVPVI
ncbi:MAG: TSUP family transporter [Nitrosopumilus sp.]|nr:MAG: TSUP family transporter [Nitrosopumilus sp.]